MLYIRLIVFALTCLFSHRSVVKNDGSCCHSFIMNKEDLKVVGTSSIYEINENILEIASVISDLEDTYFERVNCTIIYWTFEFLMIMRETFTAKSIIIHIRPSFVN